MALVNDDCLIPTLDAPELGYVKESSNQQYVPDVFFKVRVTHCAVECITQTLLSKTKRKGLFRLNIIFRPSAAKPGRPYGVMHVSSLWGTLRPTLRAPLTMT